MFRARPRLQNGQAANGSDCGSLRSHNLTLFVMCALILRVNLSSDLSLQNYLLTSKTWILVITNVRAYYCRD